MIFSSRLYNRQISIERNDENEKIYSTVFCSDKSFVDFCFLHGGGKAFGILSADDTSGNLPNQSESTSGRLEETTDTPENTTNEPEESTKPSEPNVINTIDLAELTEMVYASCGKSMDGFYNTELDSESLARYFGTDFEFEQAFASELMIGGGYSFCLVRVDADKTEEVAALIEEHADPWKWICMGAEDKVVAVNGNVVMLCMASSEECSALKAAFLAIQ